MAVPSSAQAGAFVRGFDTMLGRVAGGGIMQRQFTWALRGNPVGMFVMGMLPSEMGDGTLYTDDELRQMTRAPTRVRFQFRRDAEGVLQVYGIHTGPNGDDTVRTVHAKWNADNTAIEADLNGATILWTPRRGLDLPDMVHPEHADTRRADIFVHPIADNTDSQIEGYPVGDDIETDDFILVFPANSGLRSLYLVFSKPFGGDIKFHKPPIGLTAFPDAAPVKSKSSVQGGGGKRSRWKDRKGRIYEWDSQHGAVEMYDQQGKHLGEFDPETGEQTKPAKPGRTTPK